MHHLAARGFSDDELRRLARLRDVLQGPQPPLQAARLARGTTPFDVVTLAVIVSGVLAVFGLSLLLTAAGVW